MKRLTCEMCGSTDFVKKDGLFECQSCGCKYSPEEAKKMMIEGTVEVTGTVKVDNSGLIDSYLQIAENAIDAHNYAEAEDYANKIIEINSQSYQAWFIKGKAAGWQTTGRNNRYPESIVNWINAYTYADDEQKPALKAELEKEVISISLAKLNMECESFVKYRSHDNALDIVNTLDMLKKQLEILHSKTGIFIMTDAFENGLAKMLHSAVVRAIDAENSDYGTEHRRHDKHRWTKYCDAQDRSMILLEQAYALASDEDLCWSICNNYIPIAETVRDSCSYKFEPSAYGHGSYEPEYGFTDEGKEERTEKINTFIQRKSYYDKATRRENCRKLISDCDQRLDKIESELSIESYWKEHSEEMDALEKEKEALHEQIQALESSKASLPLVETRKSVVNSIREMESRLNSLGLFKGKEKKELSEKITQKKAELENVKNDIKAAEDQIDIQKNELKEKINAIMADQSKPRGMTPIPHGTKPELFAPGQTELLMTPIALDQYAYEKCPAPYSLEYGTEEDLVIHEKYLFDLDKITKKLDRLISALEGNSDLDDDDEEEWHNDPNVAKTYKITFHLDDEPTKISLWCRAKATDAPIEKEITFKLESGFTPDDADAFVSIVSAIIFDLFPSAEMRAIQHVLAMQIYGIEMKTKVAQDGLIISCKREESVSITISSAT